GYKFSFFEDSAFNDSLVISNYGTSFEDSIYVQFNPTDSVSYTGDCPISGGGVPNGRLPLAGIGIDSRPTLTAQVTNVSCFMAKDGSIDIVRHGGDGPYSYCWTNTGNFKDSAQDISSLSPSTYTVTVTSYAGCKMSESYVVTQPDPLIVTVVVDSMLCRNGTTTVHVTASGGTRPYDGTGNFVVGYGKQTFTVTDGHGCTDSESIYVNNGTGVPPAKPDPITSIVADATGVCGGGNFTYSVSPVINATSYTWLPPPNCSINSISIDGTQLVLTVPPDFTADSLSVTANNGCGSSVPQKKYITTLPGKPGTISGPTTVSPLQTAVTYSVSQVGSLTYVWTVPPGATITTGQNTSAITVNWGNSPGNVTVKAINSCGSSVANSFLNVTILGNTLVASVGTLPAFDSICINGISTSKYFNLAGSGLDGSNVVVKAVPGFKVSATNYGTYGDSLVIKNYGTSIKQNVYVKFNPIIAGSYDGNITTSGGGASATFVGVSGEAVNSSPALSANVTNISCHGASDGGIDLSLKGGSGPFTYRWLGPGSYDSSAQDINGLGPSDYTVTVTSLLGCKTSATYTVTQPDALILNLTADNMICKGTTTVVHVKAAGGTAPYSGTGDFVVSAARLPFTVIDAHGCSQTQYITVPNGTLVAPNKPGPITGAYADSIGLCGGGQFKYRIDTVPTATSYMWIPPANCSIGSLNGYGNQLVLIVPPDFVADTLRVTASNVCGMSVPQAKTLLAIPAKPGAISGPTSLTANQTGVVYSVKKPSAVRFNWKVPRDAQIISGQGSGSIVVNWGTLSGNVMVRAKNDCGTSTYASTLSVAVAGAIAAQQEPQSVSSVSDDVIALPNPASNIVHISFAASEIYNYTIFLSDINGKVVAEKTGITVKGENLVSFNVRNYANGIYLVTVMKENGEATRIKLLKD
ncbi:MAG TPA: T9SS type A sorting domain-containing protein, partial [Parafilimonas sp.]|nr:T9SS type A sorting domain-containing protein [Parafilimonas sp.]